MGGEIRQFASFLVTSQCLYKFRLTTPLWHNNNYENGRWFHCAASRILYPVSRIYTSMLKVWFGLSTVNEDDGPASRRMVPSPSGMLLRLSQLESVEDDPYTQNKYNIERQSKLKTFAKPSWKKWQKQLYDDLSKLTKNFYGPWNITSKNLIVLKQ